MKSEIKFYASILLRRLPIVILITGLATGAAIYVAVTFVALGVLGPGGLADATAAAAAPLEVAAARLEQPLVAWLVTLGAVTAMTGVLLNLLLGLSRVLLAMARRGDMPGALARIAGPDASPRPAVITVGLLIGAISLSGSVAVAWSFSAFTVLVYYALTNLAALRLPPADRRYPRAVAGLGLVACAALAFQVDPAVWGPGLALIAAGLGWWAVARRGRSAGR